MLAQADLVEPAVLITIICELPLKEPLVQLLKNLKVRGYLIRPVEGEDRHGQSLNSPDEDLVSIELRALVSQEIADVVFHALQDHLSAHRVMAFRQSVESLVL
jgi:hypothetical protein